MKKSEIIKKVAEHSNQSFADTAKMFEAFIAEVGEALRSGEKITISGFGTFLPSKRKQKEGVHPQDSQQRITIPPHTVPRFKPSQQLKEKVK